MPEIEDKRLRLRPSVFLALAILIGGSAASGCTGDDPVEDDPMVGVWYEDDGKDGWTLNSEGGVIPLEDGLPDDVHNSTGYDSSWSVAGDVLTLSIAFDEISDDQEFTCDDGETIPASWINDGMDDCSNGEDEGVDTSNMDFEYVTYEFIVKMRFLLVQDVMFTGLMEHTMSYDGGSSTETIPEDKICDLDRGDCLALVRSSAMVGVYHATVVSGVESPEWWADTTEQDW